MSIPDHWKILPFTDCLRNLKTKKKPSIPKRAYRESGKFPVIDQGASFIAGWTDSTESIISDNLPIVIFGDHTRIFKYVDFPFALGADGTKLLYPNESVLYPRFFYYALLNLKVPNKGYNRHYRYLRDFSIVAPPLPEQRAIAHILQMIQQAKITRQREITLERERKAALIDYLFSHGTKNEPRKETEIGEIPESWEVARLGQLGDLVRGVTYKKQEITDTSSLGYLPILRATNIQDWQLLLDELVYVKDEKVSDLQLLRRSDVIIAMSSGSKSVVGKSAQLNQEWKGSFGAFCAVFRYNSPVEPFFIGHIFQTKSYRKHLLKEARGTNINNLSKNHILDYQFPLPPLPEQHAITDVFRAIDKKIAALEQETQYLDELFHAMLDELMTGQRSVVPLIDALESKLN